MANKQFTNKLLLWVLIFAPYVIFPIGFYIYINKPQNEPPSSIIIINKSDMSLKAYDKNGEVIFKTMIATGKAKGNKQKRGDMKTPEGVFKVEDIQDASTWTHDFKGDTLGEIKGAYGPYFIRLTVPGHAGIGIHGTHDPSSIGKRVTEGCIRLKNDQVKTLTTLIKPGVPVVILPGKDDLLVKTDK